MIPKLVLDTTYLLPAFGLEVDTDSAEGIRAVLGELVKSGVMLHISDLSPFEGFIKAFRIAEKLSSESGKEEAKIGFLAVTKDPSLHRVGHSDEDILGIAHEIRKTHADPFDCFIFATAKFLATTLVTEDRSAGLYIGEDNVISWHELRSSLHTQTQKNNGAT